LLLPCHSACTPFYKTALNALLNMEIQRLFQIFDTSILIAAFIEDERRHKASFLICAICGSVFCSS